MSAPEPEIESEAAGTLPEITRVTGGVWSIPVPIPMRGLAYTIVYALESDDGLVLVDTGWDAEETWQALTAGLASIGADVSDVAGVLVTHVHIDHHGLSGRVREQSGAWVAMHRAEAENLPERLYRDFEDGRRPDWHDRFGVPKEDQYLPQRESIAEFLAMAEPDRLLDDGELAPLGGRSLRAVWTPGHTPGHLCFHEERAGLLLSGDHLLPRITPNIGIDHLDGRNALGEYLGSLDRVAALDVNEVLPAHEHRFTGHAERAREIADHHEHRLADVIGLLRDSGGMTAWELTRALRWSRPWERIAPPMRHAALAEAVAHLRELVDRGAIIVRGDQAGDSALRFEVP